MDGQADSHGTGTHATAFVRFYGWEMFVELYTLLYLRHFDKELDLFHQSLSLPY